MGKSNSRIRNAISWFELGSKKPISIHFAQEKLYRIWYTGALIIFLLLLLPLFAGRYEDRFINVIFWFSPSIAPTSALIYAISFRSEKKKSKDRLVSRGPYKMAVYASLIYFFLLAATLFGDTYSNLSFFDFLKLSHLYLGIVQSAVIGFIGSLMVSQEWKNKYA